MDEELDINSAPVNPIDLVRDTGKGLGYGYGYLSTPQGRSQVMQALKKTGSAMKLPFVAGMEALSGVDTGATEKALQEFKDTPFQAPIAKPREEVLAQNKAKSMPDPSNNNVGGIVTGVKKDPGNPMQPYEDSIMASYNMALGGDDSAIKAQDDLIKQIRLNKRLTNEAAIEEDRLLKERLDADQLDNIERSKRVEKANQNYNSAIQKMEEIGMDRPDFWTDSKLPTKILAGIGLALTSTLKNQAPFALINGLIDREANRQEQLYQSAKEVADKKGTAYSQMMGQFNNERAASDALRAGLFDYAAKKVDRQAQGLNSLEAINRANQVKNQFIAQRDQHKMNLAKFAASQQSAMRGPLDPNTPIYNVPDSLKERWVPGLGEVASKSAAKELIELKGSMDQAGSMIDELAAMADETGASLNPKTRAKAKMLQNALIGQLRLAIVGPGAMTEKEMALMKEMIANPASIMSLDAVSKSKLKSLKTTLQNKLNNSAKASGAVMPKTMNKENLLASGATEL